MTPVFHRSLVTTIRDLGYDFTTRTGTVRLPDGCCTDMSGCIRLFTRIDRAAQVIHCIAGETHAYSYVRQRGEWCYCAVRS